MVYCEAYRSFTSYHHIVLVPHSIQQSAYDVIDDLQTSMADQEQLVYTIKTWETDVESRVQPLALLVARKIADIAVLLALPEVQELSGFDGVIDSLVQDSIDLERNMITLTTAEASFHSDLAINELQITRGREPRQPSGMVSQTGVGANSISMDGKQTAFSDFSSEFNARVSTLAQSISNDPVQQSEPPAPNDHKSAPIKQYSTDEIADVPVQGNTGLSVHLAATQASLPADVSMIAKLQSENEALRAELNTVSAHQAERMAQYQSLTERLSEAMKQLDYERELRASAQYEATKSKQLAAQAQTGPSNAV